MHNILRIIYELNEKSGDVKEKIKNGKNCACTFQQSAKHKLFLNNTQHNSKDFFQEREHVKNYFLLQINC